MGAASEQMKENRRSSKRTRNMSRHNNKIKQSSKSKSNASNNRGISGYAKNNSIYRAKNKEDRKSKQGRPPQQSNQLEKKEIKRNGDNNYIGVTKPASMFVTSSNNYKSVTKADSHQPQKWNNKKQYSPFGSSPDSSEAPQGKIQMFRA